MALFCATSGLEVMANPEWVSQKVSDSFEANLYLIADSIIYSRPKGYADLVGVKNNIKILNNVLNTAIKENKSYLQIEDYSLITGSSLDARKCFADKVNGDLRCQSMIFCNTSLPLSIAVKLYSRLMRTNLDLQVVDSYKDAIMFAINSLQIERAGLDPRTFEICRHLNKDESSFDPVDILNEKFLNIESDVYSCPSFLIDRSILHSTSTGYFREEHIPLFEQMITDCHTTFENAAIKYNIVDCKNFKGIHPKARIKHMDAMKKWHRQFPLRMLIMYGVSASTKAALYIANALMPFKVRVAENIQHAFQIINEDEKNAEISVTEKGRKHLSITQDAIDGLVTQIGNLHWEGRFENNTEHNNLENTKDPLYPVYASINLIKEEIDALFEERKRSEEKYRNLVNTMHEGLVGVDENWNINFINDRFVEIIGYSREQLIDTSFYSLISKETISVAEEQHKLRMDGTEELYELELITSDKRKLTVLCSPNPSFDEDGNYLGGFGVISDITVRKTIEKEKEKLIQKLQDALNEVKTLSGLLPICSSCKKIRDDDGYWNYLEGYIEKRSNAQFSHSMCPECSDEFYGDEDWYLELKKKAK